MSRCNCCGAADASGMSKLCAYCDGGAVDLVGDADDPTAAADALDRETDNRIEQERAER